MDKDDFACPSCQGHDLDVKYTLTNPHYHTAKCKVCGFVAMHPYPEDSFLDTRYKSRELYNSNADVSSYRRAVADRKSLLEGLLRRAGIYSFAGRSLDFGAGVGIAVAAQSAMGFDALGIDSNPHAQQTGRSLFGVNIIDSSVDDMPTDLNLFTMFEVLEHIKYPTDFLRTVSKHMCAGSVIAGSVPNYNGLARYVRGKNSIALSWPEHINQFTRQSLMKTLKDAGFEVIYIGFPPPYGVSINLGFRAGLRKILPPGRAADAVAGALTWLKKYVIYPAPNAFAEKTGLLGHGLVFVGRRRPE